MSYRAIAIISVVAAASMVPATPQETPSGPVAATRDAAKHATSTRAVAGAAVAAGANQVRDTPHEWGQGAAGFGKRFGSAFGKHVIKVAIQYPAAKMFHEEFGYRRSDKQGFGPRFLYALESPIITHKTTTGDRTLSKSELAGAFGSGLISRAWQPASVRAMSYGFISGGIVLGTDAGVNVVKEFWPEIRHPRRAKAANSGEVSVSTAAQSSDVSEESGESPK